MVDVEGTYCYSEFFSPFLSFYFLVGLFSSGCERRYIDVLYTRRTTERAEEGQQKLLVCSLGGKRENEQRDILIASDAIMRSHSSAGVHTHTHRHTQSSTSQAKRGMRIIYRDNTGMASSPRGSCSTTERNKIK